MKKEAKGVLTRLLAGPRSFKDYAQLGGWLIYRPLLALIIVLLAVGLTLLTFWLLREKPPYTIPTFYLTEERLTAYSGEAILLESAGRRVYQGQVVGGRRSGVGEEYDPSDGTLRYQGGFVQDCYEGQGRLFEEGALCYEGGFFNGLFAGEGIKWKRGVKRYEGGFLAGEYEGAGTLFDEAGQPQYIGTFAAGRYEGRGRLLNGASMTYEGDFRAGRRHGEGQLWSGEGALLYKGRFSDGEPGPWGSLYNERGQCLYTGEVAGLSLDYPALLGLPVAALQERALELPTLYYGGGWVGYCYPELGLAVATRYDYTALHNPLDSPEKQELTGLFTKREDNLVADMLLVAGDKISGRLPWEGVELTVTELPGFVVFLSGRMGHPGEPLGEGVALVRRGEHLYEVEGLAEVESFIGEGILSRSVRYVHRSQEYGKGAQPKVIVLSREQEEG